MKMKHEKHAAYIPAVNDGALRRLWVNKRGAEGLTLSLPAVGFSLRHSVRRSVAPPPSLEKAAGAHQLGLAGKLAVDRRFALAPAHVGAVLDVLAL